MSPQSTGSWTSWRSRRRLQGGKRSSATLRKIRADLTDPTSFDSVVSAVLDAFGRIDILVNNAGIRRDSIRADRHRNPIRFWEITPEQWSRFVAVNARRRPR